MPARFVISGLTVFILLAGFVTGSANDTESYSEYSAETILTFTKKLIIKNEYHRARVELMRLKSYYPSYISGSTYNISEMYLLFGEGLYGETASSARRSAVAENTTPEIRAASEIFYYDSNAAMYELSSYAGILNINYPADGPLAGMIDIRKTHYYIFQGEYETAAGLIKTNENLRDYEYLITYARERRLAKKSKTAAAMWGILPGMGYVYSGDTETGITALIVIAINAGFSLFAFNTGNETIGAVTGSIGTFFYLGAAAGGYMAAEKYNTRIEHDIYDRTAEKMNFSSHRAQIMMKYGIAYNE